MVLISVKALTTMVLKDCTFIQNSVFRLFYCCQLRCCSIQWMGIFHLDEEEVQLFHILFPIVLGKQRFQEKDSISLPPPHATCWDKPVYLLLSFFGRGETMEPPTDNVRCSTTSICMVM